MHRMLVQPTSGNGHGRPQRLDGRRDLKQGGDVVNLWETDFRFIQPRFHILLRRLLKWKQA